MANDSGVTPPPPDCGRRLLSHVIDARAATNHQRPFASIPHSSNPEDGYRDISYTLLANAINRLAFWIRHEVGEPVTDCESLIYLAPADLRYQILTLAAVKVGYLAFLVSPRNSAEAFSSLLEQCGASKLLTSHPPSPGVSVMMKCRPMRPFAIPSLEELLDSGPVPHLSLKGTWEEHRFRPFVQIHSSGSTGIPKLITLKHGSLTAMDAFQLLESNELHQRLGNMRLCVTFPPFHVAGIIYALASPVWVDSTVVLPPAVPLTAKVVDAIHGKAEVEFSLLPPSVLMDLAKNPKYLVNLSKLKGVTFAGGPLPEATGEQIADRTRLVAGYGASEWIAAPQLPKSREDWPYFCFNEKEGGFEFRERDNGLYEFVICRRPDYELAQPVFVTFPEIDEFPTKDLFSKHPLKPGMRKYVSRLDDIIVFSNGEKLNPVTFESLVSTAKDVAGAMVVGQGRFQAGLLIEPKDPLEDQDVVFEKIWPFIQRANEPTVRHGRVAKDCVFFTKPDKPLPRAGKGTIQRASANALYASEIDELYTRLQASDSGKPKRVPEKSHSIDLGSFETTRDSLATFVSDEIGLGPLGKTDDFFGLGMDSLQVVNIVRAINAARPTDPIDAKHVYDNPSIDQLARSLHSEPPQRYFDGNDSDDEELKESWLAMDEMFNDLTARMAPADGKRRGRESHLNGWIRATDNGPVIQPDGGRLAWLQVLAMFLVNINNWGLVNSFGIFQAFYESTFLSDYSQSAIAWIGTLQGALLLLVGVVSGPLFDKGYFKPTLIAASVGLVFALMMLSLSTRYYQIMLTQGVLCGICSGMLYIPSVALVPVYFKHRRGLALGLATGGGSIGGVLYPIIFRRLLVEIGFAWSVRVMGFIAFVTLGIAVMLSKPIGARTRRQLVDAGAFREWPYTVFLVSAFFLLSAMFVPFFLATTYSSSQLHTSPSTSFYLISVVNAAQFFGRVLPAWSSDYHHRFFGPEVNQFLGEFLMGILGFSWATVHNLGGFIPWLILYGFFSGMSVTLPAIVLPYICPNLAVYGTRLGMLYACAGVGFLISTPVAGAANASTGGCLGSQIWIGACCVAASLLFLITGIEVRNRRLLYQKGKRRNRSRRGGSNRQIAFKMFGWDVTMEKEKA